MFSFIEILLLVFLLLLLGGGYSLLSSPLTLRMSAYRREQLTRRYVAAAVVVFGLATAFLLSVDIMDEMVRQLHKAELLHSLQVEQAVRDVF